ncbi:MAG: DUF3088 family protein [Parvularculaceae bacterium]|nr:DUF3088 family protein [Parvularculaceae bacterium]
MRDLLFLLPPGFESKNRREYCPECAEIWGLLHYYPAIKDSVEIIYQPLEHPRAALVERLGEGQWNCPTLILAETSPLFPKIQPEISNDHPYFGSAAQIGQYYAARFGTALPRGS